MTKWKHEHQIHPHTMWKLKRVSESWIFVKIGLPTPPTPSFMFLSAISFVNLSLSLHSISRKHFLKTCESTYFILTTCRNIFSKHLKAFFIKMWKYVLGRFSATTCGSLRLSKYLMSLKWGPDIELKSTNDQIAIQRSSLQGRLFYFSSLGPDLFLLGRKS